MEPKINIPGIISIVAASVAAVGALLLLFGVSPGYVSAREPGVDQLENHIKVFGPAVLLSWVMLLFSRPKPIVVAIIVPLTLVYLCGFVTIK